MPSQEDLTHYYAEKYYQEGRGSYEIEYSPQELKWKKLRAWLIAQSALSIHPDGNTFLDIGCGEGDLLHEFNTRDISVTGIDYSNVGINNLHPRLIKNFIQGDIRQLIQGIITDNTHYDFISLINVLEHVPSPITLMKDFHSWMRKSDLLIITVPNDFSALHSYLVKHNITKDQWWVGYPDHLSYFNKESMTAFVNEIGFEIIKVVADNPIDLNLLNNNSNYIEDRSKGKATHHFRIATDNFIAEIDKEQLLKIYTLYGEIGIGRDLTFYMRKV